MDGFGLYGDGRYGPGLNGGVLGISGNVLRPLKPGLLTKGTPNTPTIAAIKPAKTHKNSFEFILIVCFECLFERIVTNLMNNLLVLRIVFIRRGSAEVLRRESTDLISFYCTACWGFSPALSCIFIEI